MLPNDEQKREFLANLGYNIWIIWGHEVDKTKLSVNEYKISNSTFKHIFGRC